MRTMLQLATDCLDLSVEALAAIGIGLRRLRDPGAVDGRGRAVREAAGEPSR